MAKNNAFLSMVAKEVNRQITATRALHTQMCLDAAMIAANEVFNMGPTRATEFVKAFNEAISSIAEMTLEDGKTDKQLWFTKQKLDDRLKKICGENFVPWQDRYN